MNTINQKLRSIELCLSAHPHNEPDSEFADRISDLQELPDIISKEIEHSEINGILTGLKICKEMWAQGTISHETISENEKYYSEQIESQSCGLLPSELLKQNQEMRELLVKILKIENGDTIFPQSFLRDLKQKIIKLIESTEVKP